MNSETNFDIKYGASGGRPPIRADLHISETGYAELYLGSSWSLPAGTDTIGFFGGQIPPDKLDTLNKSLAQHGFIDKSSGPSPSSPDANTRYLVLTNSQKENQLTITNTADDPPLAELEKMMADIMNDLVKQPLRAVQVTVTGAPNNNEQTLQPTVKFTNVGTEPLPILLFEGASSNNFLRIDVQLERWDPSPGGDLVTPLKTIRPNRDDIAALADNGQIPEGIQELASKDSYTFDLPPIDLPAEENLHLRTNFTFWLPGSGPERRLVTVQPQVIDFSKD